MIARCPLYLKLPSKLAEFEKACKSKKQRKFSEMDWQIDESKAKMPWGSNTESYESFFSLHCTLN